MQHLQKAKQQVDKDFAQKAESAETSEGRVLTSRGLDLRQREAGGGAEQHPFSTAMSGAASWTAMFWHSSSCSWTKGAFI